MSSTSTGRAVITVDGLAGSGKTTLARLLAQDIGFIHLNSGLLYRGLGWLAIQHGLERAGEAQLLELLAGHRFSLVVDEQGASRLQIGSTVRGDELFDPSVSDAASRLSPFEGVRSALLDAQREAFPGYPIVAEGRDMGTVVFPGASLKFFITADAGIRASRRLAQLEQQRGGITEEQREELKRALEQEITERDRRDQQREISPTVAARDALTLDNSSVTLTDMVKAMYASAADRGLVKTPAR